MDDKIFKRKKLQFKSLGTDIEIQLIIADSAEKEILAKNFLDELRSEFLYYEKMLSRFDDQSELFKINSNLGNWQTSSEDVLILIKKALVYWKETAGFFDPRIIESLENIGYGEDFKKGNFFLKNNDKKILLDDITNDIKIDGNKFLLKKRIDFSGIAKGYIVDVIVKKLEKAGYENFLVDAGGDMYARGHCDNCDYWPVSLEGIPEEKMIFNLSDKGVATSGITRRKWEIAGQRFHHIINPKKPDNFDFELKSVTIIAEKTEIADVWAKVLFLMGKKSGMVYTKEKGLAAIFLDCRGNAWLSPKMKDFLI